MIKQKETIIKLLKALYPNIKIYLFGSYARNKQTSTSDIDLAIDTGKKLDFLEIERIRNIIQALNIPQTVDIVDLNNVSTEMKKSIESERVVWSE